MPIPDATGNAHYPVIKRTGFVAEALGDASEPFDPADGVFDLHAATGMDAVVGALGIGQDRIGAFFAAPGLAMGQTDGWHVISLD